jgi:hypothetical protein
VALRAASQHLAVLLAHMDVCVLGSHRILHVLGLYPLASSR